MAEEWEATVMEVTVDTAVVEVTAEATVTCLPG